MGPPRSSYFVRLEERDAAALDLAEYIVGLVDVGALNLDARHLERYRRARAEVDNPSIPA